MIFDKVFKERLVREMKGWQQVKARGLPILPWWEIIVKPGIRRLAINRSKEQNTVKRSRLNCLLLKQCYLTNELQSGAINKLGKLKEVQADIMKWYENESKKIILQARVGDVQESEKVRIYHHEQHQKQYKKSTILKLDTEVGRLEGHKACAEYLEGQVAQILLQPAVLDAEAQATLLAEISPVFTELDNKNLLAL